MGGDALLLVILVLVVAGLLFAVNRALSQNGKPRGE
jgi:phosphotransferase system  glucose/maltose/N-acetylglucosamine-specific IIC component